MKRILSSGIFVAIFALACGRALGFGFGGDILFAISGFAPGTKTDASGDRVSRLARAERVERLERGAEFVMSKFDRLMIKEFSRAWKNSGNGMSNSESVVLILRMVGGGYAARNLGATNEHRSFTFRWHPGAVAVVHTHPNNSDPKPQAADCQVADKYGVPIFTITIAGMFVYDPYTKKITRVQDGLNWLEVSSWPRRPTDDNV